MTREEIIANERYHTCSRCKWDDMPDEMYPCNQCKYGLDLRKDLWEYEEEEENEEQQICNDISNRKEYENEKGEQK